MVGAGHLERRLDRLRAARDRVDGRGIEREDRAELGCVRLERRARERGAVGVGDAGRLGRHDVRDAAAAVPDVHDDRPAGRIQVGATVRRVERRALAALDDRSVRPKTRGKTRPAGAAPVERGSVMTQL